MKKPTAPQSNPPGFPVIGKRVEAVVYERFDGHRCDRKCKAAGHLYIHRFKKGTNTPLRLSADRKTLTIGKKSR